METIEFSSFLKVIVATAGVLLDTAGISKFLLNTFAFASSSQPLHIILA